MTTAHGRRFAIGGAVIAGAAGAVLQHRGSVAAAALLWGVAAALALLGVFAPARALPLRAAWIGLARYPARVTQPVLVTVVFLLIITPVGVLRRTFGRSPLRRDAGAASFWVRRPPDDPATRRRRMERQF